MGLISRVSSRTYRKSNFNSIMSIENYNGGAVVAMAGKECYAIACDRRFGVNLATVGFDYEKCFQMGDRLFCGLGGFVTDIQTVHEKLLFRKNLYEQREQRAMTTKVFESMLSNMLYEHRFGPFFIGSIVAGLDTDKNGVTKPYISGTDLIGAIESPPDFVTAGSASNQLMGICEALWKENMTPDELFECISQSLMNAVDRDGISGWGASVWIVEKHQITKRTLKGRMD